MLSKGDVYHWLEPWKISHPHSEAARSILIGCMISCYSHRWQNIVGNTSLGLKCPGLTFSMYPKEVRLCARENPHPLWYTMIVPYLTNLMWVCVSARACRCACLSVHMCLFVCLCARVSLFVCLGLCRGLCRWGGVCVLSHVVFMKCECLRGSLCRARSTLQGLCRRYWS